MANYTQSIREILQMNKQPGENITDIAVITSIANRTIFDGTMVNVIDEKYRNTFITGFTLHFFNDELGLETLPLWKIALSEKLINNGAYINLMYDNLDKQIFSQYRVKKTTDDLTLAESHRSEFTETNEGTGTLENAKSGTDTITGNNTVTGGEKVTETTDMHRLETGSYTDASEGSLTSENNNTSKVNAVAVAYDTPQGKLQNQMVTPGGDRTGTGVKYISDNTFNYMTAANENDNTTVDNGSNNESTNSSTTRSFDDYDVHNQGTITRDASQSRTETVNTNNTLYNSKDTQTRNLTDNRSHDETGGKDVETNRDINDEEYTLNMEMLLKSENLLNRVWALFDDIFMQIL